MTFQNSFDGFVVPDPCSSRTSVAPPWTGTIADAARGDDAREERDTRRATPNARVAGRGRAVARARRCLVVARTTADAMPS